MGYEVVGFHRGYEGLVDPVQYVTLDDRNTAGILVQGGTILRSTNQGRFAAVKDQCTPIALDRRLLAAVATTVEQLNLSALICVGGDGSLAVAQQFHEFGIPVVGVPKTIDNDLSCTVFSFGFDSAVACATDALDRLHTTAASHERIMILEVMGRHTGWIALHCGIAGGADVILLPEIPWSFENVTKKILNRREQGRHFTTIVIAEGAALPDGQMVTRERRAEDRQIRLGGIGNVLAVELSQRLRVETRCVVLGHLQRGGVPTAFDRFLATQFGVHAVRLVDEQLLGRMVCYKPPAIKDVSIADAVGHLNTIDQTNSAIQAARGMGISFGDNLPGEGAFARSLTIPSTLAMPIDLMSQPVTW
jgi:6-phosphofructokinase 1